jgi:hypothetical protein
MWVLLLLLLQDAATAPPQESAVPSWTNFRVAVNQQVGTSTVGCQSQPLIKLGMNTNITIFGHYPSS